MPKTPQYARIAITLPKADLTTADRLARAHDRSRSWIIAESIRRFAKEAPGDSHSAAQQAPAMVSEHLPTGLGAYRLGQLTRDLALTPEERVRAAEETLRIGAIDSRGTHRIVAFDRYEDFLEWQRLRDRER